MAQTCFTGGSLCFLINNSYSKLMFCNEKLSTCRRHYCKFASVSNSIYNVCCKRGVNTDVERTKNSVIKFEEYLLQRKEQAQRTVLVQIQSSKSLNDLSNYCIQFGNINGIYHYVSSKSIHCALIEFESTDNVKAALTEATYINTDSIIPAQSNFLWFKSNILNNKWNNSIDTAGQKVDIYKNCTRMHADKYLMDSMFTAQTVSNQILLLYDLLKLNDVETRLRFVTAYQLEKSLSGLFPYMAVLPFGSSVNGFGKQGCDLDLVMCLEGDRKESDVTRLVYHTKSALDERSRSKNCMQTIADNMHYLMPCITNVRRILNARVPIIKYAHLMTGLECDLSMTNMTAIYMTELLYLFGEMDSRVRPLVFTVRKWASVAKLTNSDAPGPWITNFPLTLMVLFFLQQKHIIPTLKYLKDCADKEDIRVADYHIDCTFVRDINKIDMKQINKESLEILLLDFFRFYAEFDFSRKAISIKEGRSISKPDYSPLYICNPLETSLNVSKNLNGEEMQRFRRALRNSAWLLETSPTINKSKNWGLIKILDKSTSAVLTNDNLDSRTIQINIEDLLKNEQNDLALKSVNKNISQAQSGKVGKK